MTWVVAGAITAVAIAACVSPVPVEGAACNVEHPCPTGYGCTGGLCHALAGGPIVRCRSDHDCALGRCLVDSGFCVQCLDDDDCLASACLPDLQQCGCRENAQCATGRCNVPTATCLSCVADEQCDSHQCDLDTGTCRKVDGEGVGQERSHGGPP